ncbi:hypothetical protein NHX12_000084 [Muraenolepis orangiensis]|uniref:Caspase 1 n=1 Tax=Muraenolepis orangiensis TaxID=630683 RepID=A0A9Q0D762_9TELE|nr:hypothetical protein NHX12_000084 [Muraenolepis orangiensis]
MENLLTSLGYTVVKYRDLNGVQMDEAIEKFSQDARLPEADSVFVVIMSNGQRGAVLGVRHSSDGEADTLPVDNIFKHLNSERCPGLLNKPKVIIIQACRGALDGSVIVPDGPGSVWNEASCVQVDGSLQPQLEDTEEHIEDDGFRRVHKEKDMIAFLSCTPDTVSYRHPEHGTFFIQHIVEIFNHIKGLFRKARNANVLKTTLPQQPRDRCSLTKYFYLFPGH